MEPINISAKLRHSQSTLVARSLVVRLLLATPLSLFGHHDHHNQKLPKPMFTPIAAEMPYMSELSLPCSPSLWLLCMITTAMMAASSMPGTTSNSWKASTSTTPVGSRQIKTWKPGWSAGSSYVAHISVHASDGGLVSDTHVYRFVACDPVIFPASVIEYTNPTDGAKRKRSQCISAWTGRRSIVV